MRELVIGFLLRYGSLRVSVDREHEGRSNVITGIGVVITRIGPVNTRIGPMNTKIGAVIT